MPKIRFFEKADFPSVKQIYQQGIETGHATFQESAKDWPDWDNSVLPCCRLLAYKAKHILGRAALSAVSRRKVYSGIAEVSVYVSEQARSKGIGNMLLSHLVRESENNGFWTLQASIFPENKASIAIHKKNGFRILAVREKYGQMRGIWRDVVLMERRSKVVGISND